MTVLNFGDFMQMQIKPPDFALAPWLPLPGIAMIAAGSGVGKTWLGSCSAIAVATGGGFLDWKAPQPRPVLYVDGEMPAGLMQSRLIGAYNHLAPGEQELMRRNFHILQHTLHSRETGIPQLTTRAGQELVEKQAQECGAALIVIDNLSTLCSDALAENDAQSWDKMQAWLLKLRRQERAVLIIHHATKADKHGRTRQRGTSRHEDILDTSIMLYRLPDMTKRQFRLEFTKSRSWIPDEREIDLENDTGKVTRMAPSNEEKKERNRRIIELIETGKSYPEIAAEVKCSRATVARAVRENKSASEPEEKLWGVLGFWEGEPMALDEWHRRSELPRRDFDEIMSRLVAAGQVRQAEAGRWYAVAQ